MNGGWGVAKMMRNDLSVRVRAIEDEEAFRFQFATAGVELTHLPASIWNRLKLRVTACLCDGR